MFSNNQSFSKDQNLSFSKDCINTTFKSNDSTKIMSKSPLHNHSLSKVKSTLSFKSLSKSPSNFRSLNTTKSQSNILKSPKPYDNSFSSQKYQNADISINNKKYNIISHPNKDVLISPGSILNNVNLIHFSDNKLDGKTIKDSKKDIKQEEIADTREEMTKFKEEDLLEGWIWYCSREKLINFQERKMKESRSKHLLIEEKLESKLKTRERELKDAKSRISMLQQREEKLKEYEKMEIEYGLLQHKQEEFNNELESQKSEIKVRDKKIRQLEERNEEINTFLDKQDDLNEKFGKTQKELEKYQIENSTLHEENEQLKNSSEIHIRSFARSKMDNDIILNYGNQYEDDLGEMVDNMKQTNQAIQQLFQKINHIIHDKKEVLESYSSQVKNLLAKQEYRDINIETIFRSDQSILEQKELDNFQLAALQNGITDIENNAVILSISDSALVQLENERKHPSTIQSIMESIDKSADRAMKENHKVTKIKKEFARVSSQTKYLMDRINTIYSFIVQLIESVSQMHVRNGKIVFESEAVKNEDLKTQFNLIRHEFQNKNLKIQELEQKIIELSKLNLEYQEEIREIQELTKDVGDELIV